THEGSLDLERGTRNGLPTPGGEKGARPPQQTEKERLSAIIQELNDRFGAGLTEKDRVSLEHLHSTLTDDAALQAAARSNTRENVRLTFEQKARDHFQDMAKSNFEFYKRIADDPEFGKALLDLLVEGFWRGRED
ncbi:MAG: type I restriction endonuclease subunit R, partial [Chloroflexota bacterium]